MNGFFLNNQLEPFELSYNNLDEKLDWISVTEHPYNAIGNDIVDDTQSFIACNAYCTSTNKTMYIPNGSYRITQEFSPTCTIIGQSMNGVNLNFYHTVGGRSIKLYSDIVRPPKWSQPATTARALINSQDAFLNYVTCTTASDAGLFTAGDYVHIAAGKNPYDADDTLWRYNAIWKVTKVDEATGKVTLNGVIDAPLSDDGFNPTSPYYNPSSWTPSTVYNVGDIVYSSSGGINYQGVFECRTAGTSSSTGNISNDGDTTVGEPQWKRICYDFGSLKGTVALDSKPLIQKLDSPIVNLTFSNFTINYNGSGSASHAINCKSIAFCNFENITINGNYAIGFEPSEGCNHIYFRNIRKFGRGTVGTIADRAFSVYTGRNIFVDNLVTDSGSETSDSISMVFLESFAQVSLKNSSLSRLKPSSGRALFLTGGSTLNIENTDLLGFDIPFRSEQGSVSIGDQSVFHDGKISVSRNNRMTISAKEFRNVGQDTSFEMWLNNQYKIVKSDSYHPSVVDFIPDKIQTITFSFAAQANNVDRKILQSTTGEIFAKNQKLVVLGMETYYDAPQSGASVDVRLFKKNSSNTRTPIFSLSGTTNRVVVSDMNPYSQIIDGDGTTSRLLHPILEDMLELSVYSNSSATSGTVYVKIICLSEMKATKVNYLTRGYI